MSGLAWQTYVPAGWMVFLFLADAAGNAGTLFVGRHKSINAF